MKVVYNGDWGGFTIPSSLRPHHKDRYWDYCIKRTDRRLVEFIEARGGVWKDLRVVELPANATDFYIEEYDGLETVYAVIDGKLFKWRTYRQVWQRCGSMA